MTGPREEDDERLRRNIARALAHEPMAGDAHLAIDGGRFELGGRQWALVLDALESYAAGVPA